MIDKIIAKMPEPSSNKQLRSFGLIVGSLFCAIGLWPMLVRGLDAHTWALVLSGFFAIPALVVPAALRYPFRVWMLIGHCLGWVNTRVILTVLFYTVSRRYHS